MFYIYILISLKDRRTYVGYTNDIEKRIQEHNQGKVVSTKRRRPFKLLFSEQFTTVGEAKKRELWWKSSSGRKRMKDFFKKENNINE